MAGNLWGGDQRPTKGYRCLGLDWRETGKIKVVLAHPANDPSGFVVSKHRRVYPWFWHGGIKEWVCTDDHANMLYMTNVPPHPILCPLLRRGRTTVLHVIHPKDIYGIPTLQTSEGTTTLSKTSSITASQFVNRGSKTLLLCCTLCRIIGNRPHPSSARR